MNAPALPARVSIVGAARSGIAAAKALSEKGVRVFISDSAESEKLDFILASNNLLHLPHEASGHTEKVLEADVIIVSPGVPSDITVLQKARKRQIPVWSEIELAFRLSRAPYWAVTGSTGKSTTVSLLGAILKAAGREHTVAGNIGVPLTSVAPDIGADGVVVAEISSFQLENIDRFHPKVAVILNFMKNHLDRYRNEEEYYNAKKRIGHNMTKDDTLVLNALDERLASWGLSMQDRVGIVYFGRECAGAPCFWYERGGIFFRRKANVKKLIETREMKLAGVHNYQNACAAAAMAWSRDIAPEVIADGLYAFGGLPHRLEFVKEYKGVRYYNDSKATTAESVIAAVSSFGQNVRLIAGGRDKGCDFSVARDPIGEYVKSVHLIGEASGRIAKEWKGQSSIAMHASLEEALNAAREAAVGGDVVVLSPGCSSFDMFASYEQRGDVFKSIVEKWTKEESDE